MKYGKMRNHAFEKGMRFGRLVVDSVILPDTAAVSVSNLKYKCICDCGNTKIARHEDLRRGMTTSCGCLHAEIARKQLTTHGGTPRNNHERLYGVWAAMIARCSNPNNTHWASYGGKGVSVCDRWLDYANFRKDAYNHGYYEQEKNTPYLDILSIDRYPDPNGDYEPGNVRWIPLRQQYECVCQDHLFEYDGKVYGTAEISRHLNIPSHLISNRIAKGWSDDAISFWLQYPELNIRRTSDGEYRDKDGFYTLIKRHPHIYEDLRYNPTHPATKSGSANNKTYDRKLEGLKSRGYPKTISLNVKLHAIGPKSIQDDMDEILQGLQNIAEEHFNRFIEECEKEGMI